jgi:hypothetical protein
MSTLAPKADISWHPFKSSDFFEAIERYGARPKHKHHQDENDRGNREYWRREKALDEALKDTFPASDPVSVEQPGLPADGVNSTKTDLSLSIRRSMFLWVKSGHAAKSMRCLLCPRKRAVREAAGQLRFRANSEHPR